MDRRNVYYSGIVQGVGFRYTAYQASRSVAVGGFVRNLADGRVELVVEGSPADVETFLALISDRMKGNIRHIEQTSAPATGEFQQFSIRA